MNTDNLFNKNPVCFMKYIIRLVKNLFAIAFIAIKFVKVIKTIHPLCLTS